MFEYTDPYQGLRMLLIWPALVGAVAYFAVAFIAGALDGRLTRWQALLAVVTGACAALVTSTIAHRWDGSTAYWLAFTVGLAFAALVLLANVILQVLQAEDR